jgi:hypothetical protein
MPDDHRQATTQVINVDDQFGTHTPRDAPSIYGQLVRNREVFVE